MTAALPRARGAVRLSAKVAGGRTALDRLYQAGSLKAVFPRPSGPGLLAVLVNTAGGVTGGDRFDIAAEAGPGCHLTLTTQAAERAYRARPGETGAIRTRLRVAEGAHLFWLPQETILFDGCASDRALIADLAPGGRLTLVEPVVFGRMAMGETLRAATFADRVDLRRAGAPLFTDRTVFAGDIAARLARPAVAAGAGAMALILHVGADAEALLPRLRGLLPATAGASLIGGDLLAARLLAPDGFALRQTLIPALLALTGAELPRPWSI
jgi:urease accessory protein